MKLAELVAVADGVVTEILPLEAVAGTAAVIFVDETTLNADAAPWNFTADAPV